MFATTPFGLSGVPAVGPRGTSEAGDSETMVIRDKSSTLNGTPATVDGDLVVVESEGVQLCRILRPSIVSALDSPKRSRTTGRGLAFLLESPPKDWNLLGTGPPHTVSVWRVPTSECSSINELWSWQVAMGRDGQGSIRKNKGLNLW